MKFKAGGGKKFPRIGEGTYVARIVHLIGLGEHLRDDRNPEKGTCDKVLFTVELPTEQVEIEGKMMPRFLSKEENVFFNEQSNLYKIMQVLDPGLVKTQGGNNPAGILGTECMVQIGTTSGGKDKIVSFVKLMKGMPVPPTETELLFYDPDAHDPVVFGKLQQWVKERIGKSLKVGSQDSASTPAPDMGDDVPF